MTSIVELGFPFTDAEMERIAEESRESFVDVRGRSREDIEATRLRTVLNTTRTLIDLRWYIPGKSPTLDVLPLELLYVIAEYLPPRDLSSFHLVYKRVDLYARLLTDSHVKMTEYIAALRANGANTLGRDLRADVESPQIPVAKPFWALARGLEPVPRVVASATFLVAVILAAV